MSPDKSDQWLGMNMTSSHVISVLETQGRYANGQGQEYAMAYRVLYWREGMHKFREYRDSLGRMVWSQYIHALHKGMVILLYILGLSVCPIPWATYRVGNGL